MLYAEKVSADFADKVQDIANQLNMDADWLMYVMNFETNGTFSPSIKNPSSTAVGLIQFLESTAEGLGTNTAQLAAMTATDQLDYVQQYYQNVINEYGQITDVTGAYLAVFYPAAINKSNDWQFPQNVYNVNKIFDINNNGYITRQDIADTIANRAPQLVNGSNFQIGSDPNVMYDAYGDSDTGDDNIVVIAAAIIIIAAACILIIVNHKK